MRRPVSAAVGAVLLLAGLSIGGPAFAADEPTHALTEAEVSQLRSFLEAKGTISPDVIDELLDTARNGGEWDSANGSEPVSTKTTKKNGVTKTVYLYADGSTNELYVETGPSLGSTVSTNAAGTISGCSNQSTTTRIIKVGCKIYGNFATTNLEFKANYDYTTQSGIGPFAPSRVTSVNSSKATVFLGGYTVEYFGIGRGTSTASAPAYGEFRVNASSPVGATTVTLRVNVPWFGPASASIN